MLIEEVIFDSEYITEAQLIWARSGDKIVRKYRCTTGQRKGRIVSSPQQCSAAINIKKRMVLKRTKAQKGHRMIKKSKRTKRTNPASKRLKTLNKRK